jgi:hypothetical protein
MAIKNEVAGTIYTCNNISCKKVFNKPIKVLNLQNPKAPFMACPFCFTSIINEPPVKAAKIESPTKKQDVENIAEEKPPSCPHHFGYLSEQQRKNDYPDQCLVCKVIVKCMFTEQKNPT